MNSKKWLVCWGSMVVLILVVIGIFVYKVDPFFHFHKPYTNAYYYTIDNERSQNDGISKNFEYDALITGTSMTENFKTSEFDKIFGVNSVKLPYAGGSYKEINDHIAIALKNNDQLKTIIRCLDMNYFYENASAMHDDLNKYPTYLYDNNPFNDINYLLNRDVIFNRVYSMMTENDRNDFNPGITSFDDYARWQDWFSYGTKSIYGNDTLDKLLYSEPGNNKVHLSDEEKAIIKENITQNITSIADEYPDVKFYYYFSPYSAVYWESLAETGEIYKHVETEKYIIELILEHKNIYLFSFNNRADIITDLNNYRDSIHYGQWINSLILYWMKDGKYLLTNENYQEYLNQELKIYLDYDYNNLYTQDDYESDYYAAALLNEEITGAKPYNLLESDSDIYMSGAVVESGEDGKKQLKCVGCLNREENENELWKYLLDNEYVGAKVEVEDITGYNYLTFYGRKVLDCGQPGVFVYNDSGQIISIMTQEFNDLDNEWHQYVLDISNASGKVTIIINGGYIDQTGSANSEYLFKDIVLY